MKKLPLIIILSALLLTGCKAEGTTNISTQEDITLQTEETILEDVALREAATTQEATTPQESVPTAADETTAPKETETEYKNNERDLYYTSLVNQAVADGRKVVYLTFDDGSGVLTPSVLDILDKYGVKATFFVVGEFSKGDDNAKTMYNEILTRGHTLGIHSFTHARADIYSSLEAFSRDCNKMFNYVIELTGYTPFLWRFPGGSATMFADSRMKTEYIPYVENKGLTYYDWNVSSGDGNGTITSGDIYNNVINGVKKNDVSVVLMHDGKGHEETVAALPDILNTLINEMNCLVVPITESTTPVQSQF